MRVRVVERGGVSPASIDGAVLCHDVRGGNGHRAFPKGTVLRGADLPALLGLPWPELHVADPQAGDVHEDDAGPRIAAAAAGAGVIAGPGAGGQWPLTAVHRGILDVARTELRELNMLGGPCVYTLFDGQVVDAGETVARAKIVPLLLGGVVVASGEAIARRARGLVRVRPFAPARVGAVVQETLGTGAATRFRATLEEKVVWFGSTLVEPVFVERASGALADAIHALDAEGVAVIVVAGTRAMDPLDPAFVALDRLGATMERHGVPAHPGSLFWLAWLGRTAVIGMPACGLFSRATVFDLVLPRLLAGERVSRADLSRLGHGGLLTRDLAFRFPPYRPSASRGEVPEE